MSIPSPVIGPERTPINALIYANNLLNSIQLPPKPGRIIQPLSKALPTRPEPRLRGGKVKIRKLKLKALWRHCNSFICIHYMALINIRFTHAGEYGLPVGPAVAFDSHFFSFVFFVRLTHNLKPDAWNMEPGATALRIRRVCCSEFFQKKNPQGYHEWMKRVGGTATSINVLISPFCRTMDSDSFSQLLNWKHFRSSFRVNFSLCAKDEIQLQFESQAQVLLRSVGK